MRSEAAIAGQDMRGGAAAEDRVRPRAGVADDGRGDRIALTTDRLPSKEGLITMADAPRTAARSRESSATAGCVRYTGARQLAPTADSGAWARLGPNSWYFSGINKAPHLPFLLGFLSDRNDPWAGADRPQRPLARRRRRPGAGSTVGRRRPRQPDCPQGVVQARHRQIGVDGGGRRRGDRPPIHRRQEITEMLYRRHLLASQTKACLLTRDSIEAEAHGGVAPEVAQGGAGGGHRLDLGDELGSPAI